MKIIDFFRKLEEDFGITPYEYCQIKHISYQSVKKYLNGTRPARYAADNIEKITKGKISLRDMGYSSSLEKTHPTLKN